MSVRAWNHKIQFVLVTIILATVQPGIDGVPVQPATEVSAMPASYYHAEYRDLFKQSLRPVDTMGNMATYGLLPRGTSGDLMEHPDITATVIGDSFAGSFAGVFDDIARERGMKFTMTSIPSCAAFFDRVSMDETVRDWPGGSADNKEKVLCKRERRLEMLALAHRTPAKTIFLAANWIATPQLWAVHNSLGANDPVTESFKTLAATGKRIVVIGVVPGAHYDARACLENGGQECPSATRVMPPFEGEPEEARRMAQRANLRATLGRVLARPDVRALNIGFIDPSRGLCVSEDVCKVVDGGELLYSDTKHLTAAGARRLRHDIEAALGA